MKNEILKDLEVLPKVVVRVPFFPLSKLEYKHDISFFESILSNEFFLKSLLLANPVVYSESQKWIKKNDRLSEKKEKRLKRTLLNYWLRIHSNAVPFGFFSNLSTANWSAKSSFNINESRFSVRLDMEVLHFIIISLNRIPEIRKQIKFYPNNTIYKVNGKIRFSEVLFDDYKYSFKISAIETNSYIDTVLFNAKKGLRIDQLIEVMDDGNYSYDIFEEFIEALIENQVLYSELQINGTGENPLDNIITILIGLMENDPKGGIEDEINYLLKIKTLLNSLQSSDQFEILQQELFFLVKEKFENVDLKRLIQLDSYLEPSRRKQIKNSLKKDLLNAVNVLCDITPEYKLKQLDNFKLKFLNKYEGAFVPLLEVLDPDLGIGFGDVSLKSDNIFMRDMEIKNQIEQESSSKINSKLQSIIYQRFFELTDQNYTIHLGESDLKYINDPIKKLGTTFQIVFNYINRKTDLINLVTAGNSCAGNLIARFGTEDEDIDAILKDIVSYENDAYPNALVSEIVHVPQPRIGNVTFRKSFRNFEIPILTRSNLSEDFQIPLCDIYVGIRGSKVILISKKLKKEIIPKLTNAHNYGKNTLPIYKFLSELSYQDIIPSVRLDFGIIPSITKKIPRIQYKNIVLSKATWNFDAEDFRILLDLSKIGIDNLCKFTAEWNLPSMTTYSTDNDIGTLIIWNNIESVSDFLESIKNKTGKIFLKEFLFDKEHSFTKNDKKEAHNNEIIAFVKNKRRINSSYRIPETVKLNETKRLYSTGSEWLYIKIYLNHNSFNKFMDETLSEIISILNDQGLVNHFFYLPFQDPDFHVRVRFYSEDKEKIKDIINILIERLNACNFIDSIQTDSYLRELERYGELTIDLAERIFHIDSQFLLNNFNFLLIEQKNMLPVFVMKQIDVLLNAFDLNLELKLKLIESMYTSYAKEFDVLSHNPLKKQIDSKLREYRDVINEKISNIPDNTEYNNSLVKFQEGLNNLYTINRHKFLNIEELFSFLRSIIHMHSIRCFPEEPRQNEIFIYQGMFLYYKKIKYTSLQNQV